jgi:beta-glucosidase
VNPIVTCGTGTPAGACLLEKDAWAQARVPVRHNHRIAWRLGLCLATLLALSSWRAAQAQPAAPPADGLAIQSDIPPLQQVFSGYFTVGAAIWPGDISGPHSELLKKHFNSITAENAMKWAVIEPTEGNFNFAPADSLVGFAKANHMLVRGHTLCWHKQLPPWVFKDASGNPMTPTPENKALLLRRLENHIRGVVSHYKDDVYAWDVVNEVIDSEEPDGFRRSPWFVITGTDYIDRAFRVAHEVAPEAKLFINDYDTTDVPKRTFLYNLVRDLRKRGVPLDSVGHQMHSDIKVPSVAAIAQTVNMFSALDVDNQITELDLSVYHDRVSRYATIPQELLQQQAYRYKEFFNAFRKLKGKISSVTFWGMADDHTWLKSYFIRRLDLPLPFDERLQAKPAYWGIVDASGLSKAGATDGPAYKDLRLPVEQRVSDLVSRMTLEEKVSQLGHAAAAIPRLGIPEYNWWNEGLHGVARAGTATVFPQAIGLAATFDAPLIHEVADTISTEFRAKYYSSVRSDGSADWYRGLTVWSPNINIFRDPRWGRGQETYGEDPYLTSRIGVAFVTGLQGDDSKYLKTVATPKHFAVHSGPEPTRHSVDIQVSRHDLEDTYLPAFRATIMEAGADSVMCAYNSVNGQPACANTALLQEHLRQDWGFPGYVVSDCGAVADVFSGHHFAPSMAGGAAVSLRAGTDLVCGAPQNRNQYEHEGAIQAVQQGLLREADLDRAVERLFTARFRLGMFDPPAMVSYSKISPAENDTEEHRRLALRAAQESLVLLKNALLKNKQHFLPLQRAYKTIAVIGPDADSLDGLEGNYNGTPSKPVTILAGLRKRFGQSHIIYAEGTGLIGPATKAVPADLLFTGKSLKRHGLKAEYFSNTKLEGKPVLTRMDKSVNFRWGTSGISPQLSQNYSARWTGVLVPRTTGDYLLGFSGQDGFRLWLDGNVIAEDWTTHRPATMQTHQVHLVQNHAYAIKIEYFQTVRFAEARLVWSIPEAERQAALKAARDADLVILVLGLSARIEGEEMKVQAEGFAGGDRTSIDLPKPQEELLEAVHALHKPTVLVLLNGSALAVNWADQNLPAILEAWYPGEEGGTAVAQALAGDFSPAGRLPVTFYKSVDQLPPFEDYSMAKRTYRYFDGEPLYPFGYGLSYATFAYSNPRVDRTEIPADGTANFSVDVANAGSMSSDEVVELYLTHQGVAGAPLRALQGFQRVRLDPGQRKTVSFTLRGRDLSIVNDAGQRQIVPGNVQVWIGGGQPGSNVRGAKTQFTIKSGAILPD